MPLSTPSLCLARHSFKGLASWLPSPPFASSAAIWDQTRTTGVVKLAEPLIASSASGSHGFGGGKAYANARILSIRIPPLVSKSGLSPGRRSHLPVASGWLVRIPHLDSSSTSNATAWATAITFLCWPVMVVQRQRGNVRFLKNLLVDNTRNGQPATLSAYLTSPAPLTLTTDTASLDLCVGKPARACGASPTGSWLRAFGALSRLPRETLHALRARFPLAAPITFAAARAEEPKALPPKPRNRDPTVIPVS
ncbi:hypothetical protein FB451DRAFT_1193497 [Mycena latifolia]|nr:hypothetical protein FB451DRAFT_1193497 [Mycena latifolia]